MIPTSPALIYENKEKTLQQVVPCVFSLFH